MNGWVYGKEQQPRCYEFDVVRFFNISLYKLYSPLGNLGFSLHFKEDVYTCIYKIRTSRKGVYIRILAIFPSCVDVADIDEAEKEIEKEFGKLVKE